MSEAFTTRHVNLAQPRLGAQVVAASDDFFADKARLIKPEEPVFIAGKYDDHGKWMDGWESRRRRTPGHDWAIVRLGQPGTLAGFEIDTRHFTGNYPPFASIDACRSDENIPTSGWVDVVPKMPLQGDHQHFVEVQNDGVFTHVRLNIYPDGGVARLRIYGDIRTDWAALEPGAPVNLAALELGARAVGCNDAHFGVPENMLAPGAGANMGDGWETRRRREPGHDWAVIALAHPGMIERVVVDTAFFKGNYPDRFFLQGTLAAPGTTDDEILAGAQDWPVLLGEHKLGPDRVHDFTKGIAAGPVSHVRLNIIPDGGISRLRLWGRPLADASAA